MANPARLAVERSKSAARNRPNGLAPTDVELLRLGGSSSSKSGRRAVNGEGEQDRSQLPAGLLFGLAVVKSN
ncbi:unnamed protein product [Heligmosomoides polygyrus]|uniref:Conserved domain protein n=1 Tax=Heligmosomoides polygyrus TaxID=6339 RepID=A0A183FXJ9_HELPZ|nr:unnamed protein product [Heligmosomoides polygyrus]